MWCFACEMFLELKTQFPVSGEDETAMMEIPQWAPAKGFCTFSHFEIGFEIKGSTEKIEQVIPFWKLLFSIGYREEQTRCTSHYIAQISCNLLGWCRKGVILDIIWYFETKLSRDLLFDLIENTPIENHIQFYKGLCIWPVGHNIC